METTTHTPEITPGSSLLAPSVYAYKNYREYLAAWTLWKKQSTARFSGAVFARRAGIQSHTLLGMIIKGKRNLGSAAIRAFARALTLSAAESDYFEKLVLFNQATNFDDRSHYLHQLAVKSKGEVKQELTRLKDFSKYLSGWHVVAIREMVDLEDFQPSPEWMAKKLKNKISVKQAEDAWYLLLELGMVRKVPQSEQFETTNQKFEIDPGGVNFALRGYHKHLLDRAKDAVDQEPITERELSSLTISVNDEDYELVKRRINEFRQELNSVISTNKGRRTRVISFNTQMISLTHREKI